MSNLDTTSSYTDDGARLMATTVTGSSDVEHVTVDCNDTIL